MLVILVGVFALQSQTRHPQAVLMCVRIFLVLGKNEAKFCHWTYLSYENDILYCQCETVVGGLPGSTRFLAVGIWNVQNLL